MPENLPKKWNFSEIFTFPKIKKEFLLKNFTHQTSSMTHRRRPRWSPSRPGPTRSMRIGPTRRRCWKAKISENISKVNTPNRLEISRANCENGPSRVRRIRTKAAKEPRVPWSGPGLVGRRESVQKWPDYLRLFIWMFPTICCCSQSVLANLKLQQGNKHGIILSWQPARAILAQKKSAVAQPWHSYVTTKMKLAMILRLVGPFLSMGSENFQNFHRIPGKFSIFVANLPVGKQRMELHTLGPLLEANSLLAGQLLRRFGVPTPTKLITLILITLLLITDRQQLIKHRGKRWWSQLEVIKKIEPICGLNGFWNNYSVVKNSGGFFSINLHF